MKPVSDVWSIAATVYFMLTGAVPYPFTDKRDPIEVILNEPIVPLEKRDKSLPRNLCACIDKALSLKATDRHPTAGDFMRSLRSSL
jgi:serine/threonine-protein kinase